MNPNSTSHSRIKSHKESSASVIGITHDFGSSGGAGSGDGFPPLPGQTAYTAADYGCEDFDEVSEKSN